jgi:hypothetical protein
MIPTAHEFYATTRLRPRRRDVRVRVRAAIVPGSWEIWGGVPVRTVPATIDDLLGDNEDESTVAQVARDALDRGLVRREALLPAIERHTKAYGHSTAEEFLAVLVGDGAQA